MQFDISVIHSDNKENYEPIIQALLEDNIDDFTLLREHPDMTKYIDLLDRYEGTDLYFIIGRTDDKIVGFIVAQQNRNDNKYPVKSPFTHVLLSLVDRPYRGKGLANKLNERLLEYERKSNTKRIFRSTWETNEEQLHLYEKFGFKLIGRKVDHGKTGLDSLYYARTLDKAEELVDYSLDTVLYEA